MGPLFCIVITVLTHAMLARYGFEWTHSDYALIPVTADEFLRGHFSAYVFSMDYAGTTLQIFRALWVKFWTLFIGTPFDISSGPIEESALKAGVDLARIYAHNAFSYVICPILLSVSSYFLTRAYVSKSAAWFVGTLMAVGLDFLILQYGNDAYVAYLVLGSALLIWKASVENPFWTLNPKKLVMAGILCGLAIYTSRISMLFVFAFLLPWNEFTNILRKLLLLRNSVRKIERIGLGVGLFLMSLWIYLELFGPSLGTLAGRAVKIHAQPNFHFGILVLALTAISAHREWIRANVGRILKRSTYLSLGVLIGSSPEWIHSLRSGAISSGGGSGIASVADGFRALGTLPSSLKEIITASSVSPMGANLFSQGSLLLLTCATVSLVLEARRKPKLYRPIVLLGALSIFAYCRIHTYTFANARYLLPILPVLWVAMGCAWEQARRQGIMAVAVLSLFALLHSTHQLKSRFERVELVKSQTLLIRGIELIKRFRHEGITVVSSDEYWWATNNLTWLADMNPIFEPLEGSGLRTSEGEKRIKMSQKIGILQASSANLTDTSKAALKIYGLKWNLESLGTIDSTHILLGNRTN